MNFFVNAAMGLGNSGVEHAEFYRAARFEQANLPYRFVFLDLIKELRAATAKWQLADERVLNLWEYCVFGGDYLTTGAAPTQAETSDLIIDSTDTHRLRTTVTDTGMRIVEHLVKYPDQHHPDNPVLLVGTSRIELFAPNGERKVMFELIDDVNRGSVLTNIHLFAERGQHRFFQNAVTLYQYFFAQLAAAYPGPSNWLIDRGENTDEALVSARPENSHLLYMVHADQLADRDDVRYPLWNNHYEYLLDHLAEFDRVVVATELQRQDLLVDFPTAGARVVAIPVGGVSDAAPAPRPARAAGPLRLITASRLASEKHIDLAIRAVAAQHAAGQAVTFDIYGAGGEESKLRDLIKELKADDYIQLKGLSNTLATVYPQYDAFISASFSEGFGLTYIESLNAGLPVITLKARFGALALIQDGVNGFLQDFKRDDADYTVAQLQAGLTRAAASDLAGMATRASVADYQDHVIAGKWRALIDAL